jgi:hypothetical protein
VRNVLITLCLLLLSVFALVCHALEAKSEFMLENGTNVSIVEDVFDETEHDIEKYKDSDDYIFSIDGNIAHGALEVPKTYVKSITVIYQGQIYSLDSSDMYNAWGDRTGQAPHTSYFFGDCKDKYNCTFRGIFADAGAAYRAEWKIINGKSVRTVIGYSIEAYFLSIFPRPNLYENKLVLTSKAIKDNAIKLNLTDANVTISKDVFNKSKSKIEKCKNANAICLINDHVPFGVPLDYYKIPKTYLKDIIITHKGENYSLNASDMYDMDLVKFGGTCNKDYNACAFRGVFTNGENDFAAQWWLDIDREQSNRSALTFSPDVVKEFLEYIDANIFYD